jgi:hypothetical protein
MRCGLKAGLYSMYEICIAILVWALNLVERKESTYN